MIYEIISFYKSAPVLLKDLKNLTLGNYLDNSKISKYFINYHIIPMAAALGLCHSTIEIYRLNYF